MAKGIKDKVAIIGMGCSRFGERWDCGPEELILEAFKEALADAGIGKKSKWPGWACSIRNRARASRRCRWL
jgi:acetyl-CoA C-acetyltransferase